MAQAQFMGTSYTRADMAQFFTSMPAKAHKQATSVAFFVQEMTQKGLDHAASYTSNAKSSLLKGASAASTYVRKVPVATLAAIKSLKTSASKAATTASEYCASSAAASSSAISGMVSSAKTAPGKWKKASSSYFKAQFEKCKHVATGAKAATIRAMIYGATTAFDMALHLSFRVTCLGTKFSLNCTYKVIQLGLHYFKGCSPAEYLGQKVLQPVLSPVREQTAYLLGQCSLALEKKHSSLFQSIFTQKIQIFAQQELMRLVKFGLRSLPFDSVFFMLTSSIGSATYPNPYALLALIKKRVHQVIDSYHKHVSENNPDLTRKELFAIRVQKMRLKKAVSAFIDTFKTHMDEKISSMLFFTDSEAIKRAINQALENAKETIFPKKIFENTPAIKRSILTSIEEELPRIIRFATIHFRLAKSWTNLQTQMLQAYLQKLALKTADEHLDSMKSSSQLLSQKYYETLVEPDETINDEQKQALKENLNCAQHILDRAADVLIDSARAKQAEVQPALKAKLASKKAQITSIRQKVSGISRQCIFNYIKMHFYRPGKEALAQSSSSTDLILRLKLIAAENVARITKLFVPNSFQAPPQSLSDAISHAKHTLQETAKKQMTEELFDLLQVFTGIAEGENDEDSTVQQRIVTLQNTVTKTLNKKTYQAVNQALKDISKSKENIDLTTMLLSVFAAIAPYTSPTVD